MLDLSIIIVSFNTEGLTKKCLERLVLSLNKSKGLSTEIIVVDNASTDQSINMLKKVPATMRGAGASQKSKVKNIFSSENLGFGKANNMGIAAAEGKYILLLNSDVMIDNVNFSDLIYYMNKNPAVGVITVSVRLEDGTLDWASHRGFPTVWNAFTYYSGLETIFSKFPLLSKQFGGYHLTHLDLNTIHEIDSPNAAFYLTRKELLDDIGGFDTRFFMYGEDLDLSYRIKKQGFKIIYYPLFQVTHLKYQSGLKRGVRQVESKTKDHFYEAMKIFYDKHFAPQNWPIKNKLVHFFIDIKKKI